MEMKMSKTLHNKIKFVADIEDVYSTKIFITSGTHPQLKNFFGESQKNSFAFSSMKKILKFLDFTFVISFIFSSMTI